MKQFDEFEKNMRLNFALRSLNLDLKKLIFMDESSFQTKKYGTYVNRRPSSSPKYSGIKERFSQTVHVWGAISESGVVCFKVTHN